MSIHQGNYLIKKDEIGKDLEIFALSEIDNSVEGYLHKKHPIMGVMWHPERDSNDSSQQKLIDVFFNKTCFFQ